MDTFQRKLKLGLMVDSYTIPAWAHYAIERCVQSGCAEIKLLIVNAGNRHRHEGCPSSPLAYRLLSRVDGRVFRREMDPFLPREITSFPAQIPSMEVMPIRSRFFCALDGSTICKIRKYDLDVLVQIGFSCLNIAGLAASRYGTWYYRHSDDTLAPNYLPGFWEVINNHPETGTSLRAAGGSLNFSGALCRSWYSTYPLSPSRNRSYYFWAAASLLPRQIEMLHQIGECRYLQEVRKSNANCHAGTSHNYGVPSNLRSLLLFAKIFARSFGAVAQRMVYKDTWYLLFDVGSGSRRDYGNFRVMMPPEDRFWADPMVIRSGDKYFIFIEELLYKDKKGHISVIEMDCEGNWKSPVPILRTKNHLSYPLVFQWEDTYYMIPESQNANAIDLYECESFPFVWHFKMHLMNHVKAVDTTLFHYANRWWLFTAMADPAAAHPQVELFLYYADDFRTAQWHPHHQNPIVSDARKARPAGRIFMDNGRIYRPSQDCTTMYGYGFDMNEVKILTETEYQETTVESVRPHWGKKMLAMHTYANDNDLTVIDAFTRRPRFLLRRPEGNPAGPRS